MIKDYKHIIDILLKTDKEEIVDKISTWREKVYPKPYIWVDASTLKSINLNKSNVKNKT